jgi:polysaccharide export outer membrane protein
MELSFATLSRLLLPLLRVMCGALAVSTAHGQESRASALTPTTNPASALSSASTVAYTNSMAVLDDHRKLSNGDRVSFRVVEDRKPPTQLMVADSGEMEVPLIGRVVAGGKTCKQLAWEIKRLLDKDYFYNATVIVGLDSVSAKSRGRIYIWGQVRNQGALEIPSDEAFTVSRAILRAGGFADFANRKAVKLTRKNGDKLTVDVVKVLEKGQVDKDVELQPDDIISVPQRLVNF